MEEEVKPTDEVEKSQVDENQNGEPEKREDRRAQHDFLRFKQEAKQAQEENAKLQERLRQVEEQTLQEKSNYKELYGRYKEENERLKSEKENDQRVFFNNLKNTAVEREALKLGIRDEALEDIRNMKMDGVITETTSEGNVNILGAQEFVEGLKNSRPYWFKQQGAPNINTGTPSYTGNRPLTASDLLKLQETNPEKYKEEIMKKIKGQR